MTVLLPSNIFFHIWCQHRAITLFPHIAIAACLNDEKVGERWKSLDGKMYLACIHFFAASKRRYASSADSKRELQPGRDSRDYILRDNSIMFHGWCTHALARCWSRRFTTQPSYFRYINFAVDRYKRYYMFSLGNTCVIERNRSYLRCYNCHINDN